MFEVVVLVVFLGLIERAGGRNGSHDLSAAEPALPREFIDVSLRLSGLIVIGCEDGGSILGASVGALPIQLGRIVELEEPFE